MLESLTRVLERRIGGLLLTLHSASMGVKALMEGLNVITDEEEDRSFLKLNLGALALTLSLMMVMIVSLGPIMIVPALLSGLGLGSTAKTLGAYLPWPILALGLWCSLRCFTVSHPLAISLAGKGSAGAQ